MKCVPATDAAGAPHFPGSAGFLLRGPGLRSRGTLARDSSSQEQLSGSVAQQCVEMSYLLVSGMFYFTSQRSLGPELQVSPGVPRSRTHLAPGVRHPTPCRHVPRRRVGGDRGRVPAPRREHTGVPHSHVGRREGSACGEPPPCLPRPGRSGGSGREPSRPRALRAPRVCLHPALETQPGRPPARAAK